MARTRATFLFGSAWAALACVAGAGQAFALSLSNNRPLIEREVGPGEAVQGSIEVTNTGDKPMEVRAYLEDWRYLPTGEGDKEFDAPGTYPRSAAGWISFYPTEFELPPHGRGVVDYTIRVTDEAALDGGYYAVLFFESIIGEVQPQGGSEVTVKYAARLGSLFMIDVTGTVRRDASLAGARLSSAGGGATRIEGTIVNEGNVALRCDGTYHLLGAGELVAARGELPRRYLWVGQSAPFEAEWVGSLAPGAYSAVLTYDCGADLILVEEAQVSVR
ncbi:MAG TPA: hypothetical protein VGB20_00980 [bacterium]